MMEEEEVSSSSTVESALLKLLNVLLKFESLGMNEGHGTLVSLSLFPPFINTITQCCRPPSIMMVESSISLASCT